MTFLGTQPHPSRCMVTIRLSIAVFIAGLAAQAFSPQALTNPSADASADSRADGSSPSAAGLRGITRNPGGSPLDGVKVVVHTTDDRQDRAIVSGADGAFSL